MDWPHGSQADNPQATKQMDAQGTGEESHTAERVCYRGILVFQEARPDQEGGPRPMTEKRLGYLLVTAALLAVAAAFIWQAVRWL